MKKMENVSEWFIETLLRAEIFDYGPVKGTQVIRPRGYAIWEKMRSFLDKEIRAHEVKNAYFPMFIPESYLKKEKEHVEGFAPEVALVTYAGGEKLDEPVVVRPTSETLIYSMFSKWIQSYRDLPIKINQWVNVVRWEKRTFPFFRTSEFLWQEGHCAFATKKEAEADAEWALKTYEDFFENTLAIPGIAGKKSESEKFPGAVRTMTFEVLMPDGKALQSCTSHFLGQNFSTSFDIKFQNENGKLEKVWQSTWGLSTRALGAVLMVHGDDKGLILPPKIAPEQVVVIPIFKEGETSQKIQATELILQALSKAGYSDVIVDMDTKTSVGWKFNQYELFGVPLRIEIGSKEFKEKKATLVRRDTGERSLVSLSKLGLAVNDILADIQDSLFELANAFLKQNTYEIADYEEFKNVIENKRGFIYSPWCESEKCEAKVKEETKATIRCLPLKQPEKSPNRCLVCGKKATVWAVFARSY